MPSDTSELGSRTRSGVLWLSTTTFIWQVISWALTLVTARILVPADYGLVAIIESLLPYLVMVAKLELTNFVSQKSTVNPDDEKGLFSLSIATNSGVAILGFLVAPLVGEFYRQPEVVLPLQLLSLSFLIRGLGVVPDALLRREMAFKSLGIMNLVVGVSRAVLQVILALLGFGFWALFVGLLYRDLMLTLWCVALRGLPRGFKWQPALVSQALSYGVTATVASLCWVLFSTADYIVVGRLFGKELLGFYSFAFLLADLPLAKVNTVLRSILPPLYGQLRERPAELVESFLNSTRAYAVIVFPSLIGLALVAHRAVPVVLGERWLPLTVPLQVMCVATIFRSLTDNIAPLLLGTGHARRHLIQNGTFAVVMPCAFALLGTTFGIIGVYGAWLVVYPIVSVVALIQMSAVAPIRWTQYFKNFLLPAFATAGMAGVVVIVPQLVPTGFSELAVLVLQVGAGILVYGGFLSALGLSSTLRAFQLVSRT